MMALTPALAGAGALVPAQTQGGTPGGLRRLLRATQVQGLVLSEAADVSLLTGGSTRRNVPAQSSSPTSPDRGEETLPSRDLPSQPAPGLSESGAADQEIVSLVARAQAGDAEAFGELYDRYVDLIYRYIYYRVGSQALAEDLTSETFLRALRRISSFTWQGRDVAAWFVTIARNLITDHYKSSRYRLEMTTADMLTTAGDHTDESTPEDEVITQLTNVALLTAIKKLNAEQQECVVLRFLQGMSVSETALAMGKNEGAIKALQYRAVRTLGRLLPDGTV